MKNYYTKNRHKILERAKVWYTKNREIILEKRKAYRKRNKEIVRATQQRTYRKFRDKRLHNHKNYMSALKARVIQKYGGRCDCCEELRIEFLTVEHINHDGKIDREKFSSTYQFYKFLINAKKRDDLTILCWNCNMATRFKDVCPHSLGVLENASTV